MSDKKVSVIVSAVDKFTAPAKKIVGASKAMTKQLNAAPTKAVEKLALLQSRLGAVANNMAAAKKETAEAGRALGRLKAASAELDRAFQRSSEQTTQLSANYQQQRDRVSSLRTASQKAKATVAELKQQIKETKNPSNALRTAFANAKTASENLAGELLQQKTALSKLNPALEASKKETQGLKKQLTETRRETQQLEQRFQSARGKSDGLKRAHHQQKEVVSKLRAELRSAGVDTRNLVETQRKLAANAEKATQKLRSLASAQAKFDKTLRRAAYGSVIASGARTVGQSSLNLVGNPIAQMRQVERSRGELASLGVENIDAIAEKGRAMAMTLAGIDTASFVAAAYDIKSGVATLSDLGVAEMTEQATFTAKATKSNVAQMTSLFATGYGSFKNSLFADSTDQEFGAVFSASLSAAVKQFKTDGAKMQVAIQAMGSGLAESGIRLEDQFTALGMLQQKMEAGVAGTTLKAIERSAGVAQERFEAMGLSIQTLDANGNLRQLPELLDEMQQAFGSDYTTEIGSELQKAFGSEEAVKFFKALWGQQAAFRANSRVLKDVQSQGMAFTRTMAAAMDNNMDARLQVMQQRWDVTKEKIGRALIPVLEKLLPLLERGADWLSRVIDGHSGLVTALVGVVGGIGVIATVAAPVVIAISALTAAIAYLGLTAKKASLSAGLGAAVGGGKRSGRRGMMSKAGGMLKGKLGLVGAGVGALSIGSTLLDDTLSAGNKAAAITRDVGGLGGALGGAAAGAAIGSVVPVIGTAVGGLIGSIAGGLGGGFLADKLVGLFKRDEAPEKTTELNRALSSPAVVTSVANQTNQNTQNFQMVFNQQPGQSNEDLAERVAQKIKEQTENAYREQLFDGD